MKHKILLILLACFTLASCIDDDFVDSCGEIDDIEVPDYLKNGYSLSLKVTLDRMGGTRAATATELEEIENYINPEKFRVLFFDHEDKLLFESKSRWVKMLTPTSKNAEWLVSVPLFTYGNDVYNDAKNKEWPWERIKEALTTNSFKIAILANRHDYDWYPGFSNTGLGNEEGWMDNTGPHWTPDDFRKKTIFDLHHCQYDAVYHGKSAANNGSSDFYDFIAKDYYKKEDGTSANTYADYRPQLGATSSWAEWDHKVPCTWLDKKYNGTNYNDKNWVTKNGQERRPVRRFRHPSQSHPIPMYGVQKFNRIEGWSKGTPFNLSEFFVDDDYKYPSNKTKYVYKNISLLRSVVKIELKIPKDETKNGKDKPYVVGLYYSNLYARCEPMDVWTPTDELWDSQHPGGFNFTNNSKCKDMQALLNYGPVATGPKLASGTGKLPYQRKLSWFYGAWLDKNPATDKPWWGFEPFDMTKFVPATDNTPYPRIFNSYIQRNNAMVCDDNVLVDDPNYWYYVVYLGERNINDPSELGNMGNSESGKPTLMYWMFEWGGKLYGLPITDYSNINNPVYNYKICDDIKYNTTNVNDANYMVLSGVPEMTGAYAAAMMTENDPDNRPWPLIRNHVYTLTLTTNDIPPYTHTWDFTKFGEETETIKNMGVDKTNWQGPKHATKDSEKDCYGNFYAHWYNLKWPWSNSSQLKANGQDINELKDLSFKNESGDEKETLNFERVYGEYDSAEKIWSEWYLRINKNVTIIFPKVKKGQIITIKGSIPVTATGPNLRRELTVESSGLRFITKEEDSEVSQMTDGKYQFIGDGKSGANAKDPKQDNPIYTFKWEVTSEKPIKPQFKTGAGIAFTEFRIEEGSAAQNARTTRGTENGIGFKIKAQDLHSESIKFD